MNERGNGKTISNIKFHPWVGNNYEYENPKILILGESHYGNANENKEIFTQNVVKDWALRGEGSHKFFTTIAKILPDRMDIWLSNGN